MIRIEMACPRCSRALIVEGEQIPDSLRCEHCDWERHRSTSSAPDAIDCPACGCDDLWRQKNFPQALGLAMVALAAGLSTWAWWQYEPAWALGILLFFALIDWLLYMFMPDVLVCYRCRARLSGLPAESSVPKFNLEIQERYRQQAIQSARQETSSR